MPQAEGEGTPVKVEFDNFEHGFPEGFGPAALCLLGEFRFSDEAGFVLAIGCGFWQWRQRARASATSAA